MNERSARALLGLFPSATTGQIKRAYRRLALELHPDRGGDPAAFQRLVAAQDLLLASATLAPVAASPRTQWVQATADVRRPPAAPRPAKAHAARRRLATPPPAQQRCFGDVLAEKLAAA